MKKGLMIVLAVLISVAFVTTVFAQAQKDAKPAAAPAKAADKAAAPAEKKVEKKEAAPKVHQFTGDVMAVDATAKTLTAKNQKGEKVFDIAGLTKATDAKAGDKVLVKYVEKDGKDIAQSVKVTKAGKKAEPKKEEAKKEAPKKDEKPAAAAPATPAAPAKK